VKTISLNLFLNIIIIIILLLLLLLLKSTLTGWFYYIIYYQSIIKSFVNVQSHALNSPLYNKSNSFHYKTFILNHWSIKERVMITIKKVLSWYNLNLVSYPNLKKTLPLYVGMVVNFCDNRFFQRYYKFSLYSVVNEIDGFPCTHENIIFLLYEIELVGMIDFVECEALFNMIFLDLWLFNIV